MTTPSQPCPGSDLIAGARAEVDRLNAWKAEALASLNSWHDLKAAVPAWFAHCRLGQSWPKVIADYIGHLEATTNVLSTSPHPIDWDHESFCTVDGCHRPATHWPVTGMAGDTPLAEALCCHHAQEAAEL